MTAINTERLIWRKVDSQMVILDLEEATYFTLNDAASTIWLALSEGATPEEAAENVFRDFDIDRETARRDTQEYIQQLTGLGLINHS